MERVLDLGNGIKLGGKHHCVMLMDAGVNHGNDLQKAKELIRTAKESKADAIKFQTYTADEISTKTAPRYWDPKLDKDNGVSQYDMFKMVGNFPKKYYQEVKEYATKLGIAFSSSPFGMESAKFLVKLDVDFFKIASAEIASHQMIRYLAATGKPMILSTGTASIGEIEEALGVIYNEGNQNVALQHCVLSYPCADKDTNLAKMLKLKQIFPDIPVGYSDHTRDIAVPLAAVALGARSIEKHYALAHRFGENPDESFSITPERLKEFISMSRSMEASIGTYQNTFYEAEAKAYRYARKSIVAITDIPKGTMITKDMVDCKRPGTGISPKYLDIVIGRQARRTIKNDTVVTWEMV
jgi:sialic acid synthase SpsE